MNKQELIEEIKSLKYYNASKRPWVDRGFVLDLVEKLDEPQKPVVPQFVADWYEECKNNLEYNLWSYIYNWGTKEECDFKNWLDLGRNNPIQTLINMHQFGYEVEEKRYTVKIKAVDQYLVSAKDENFLGFLTSKLRTYFTRKELEEAGFGEVFNSPLFEVEEVEE